MTEGADSDIELTLATPKRAAPPVHVGNILLAVIGFMRICLRTFLGTYLAQRVLNFFYILACNQATLPRFTLCASYFVPYRL